MHGLEDLRERVVGLESDVSQLSAKVSQLSVEFAGAIENVKNLRISQDGVVQKIDTLITTVTELKAQYRPPVDPLEVMGRILNIAGKSATLVGALVGALFMAFQYWSWEKKEAVANQPPPAYVVIEGKKYRITQPQ